VNNNTIIAGVIVGGAVLVAAGAIAYNSGYNPLQEYATVVSVAQAYDTTQTPRIVCGDEATLAAARSAAPAPADAASDFAPSTPPAPRCLTVYDTASVESGFDVTYELDGEQKVVRMDRNPGPRIPVEDGELIVSQS